MDKGRSLENVGKQSCHSCMQCSALTCSTNPSSTTEMFLMIVELCNRNEVKIEIRGDNLVNAVKKSCHILHARLHIDLFYNPTKYH